jgi:hypothetical protein
MHPPTVELPTSPQHCCPWWAEGQSSKPGWSEERRKMESKPWQQLIVAPVPSQKRPDQRIHRLQPCPVESDGLGISAMTSAAPRLSTAPGSSASLRRGSCIHVQGAERKVWHTDTFTKTRKVGCLFSAEAASLGCVWEDRVTNIKILATKWLYLLNKTPNPLTSGDLRTPCTSPASVSPEDIACDIHKDSQDGH